MVPPQNYSSLFKKLDPVMLCCVHCTHAESGNVFELQVE